jgi:prepilin-type N-terminal cleavage/methylation domain-containing protein
MKSGQKRSKGCVCGNPGRGFTLIELLVVIGMIFIIAGMAMVQLQPAWQQSQANAGMDQIKSVLRTARETAISQRRTIAVKFTGNNTISLYQFVVVGATSTLAATPFLTMPIQKNVTFMTFSAMPDTPDAFGLPGGGSGIEFGLVVGGPPSGMQFQSDGTFTDGSGIPINGTVFLGVTNIPATARATTVLGNTGRVRGYYGTGKGWFQQ